MFALSNREKALRTIELDKYINQDNCKTMDESDRADFQEAIALTAKIDLGEVQRRIQNDKITFEDYPELEFLVREAIEYYQT